MDWFYITSVVLAYFVGRFDEYTKGGKFKK